MAPVVLAMDVHCDSCAKKIRKAVMKVPGAESVTASYETGLVMVQGTADAAVLMARLQAKTKKPIKIVSDGTDENGEAAASAGASGSPPPPTILLEMELHCGSCAERVERRVMEIPGVDSVTTDVPGRRVTVTGTADASAVATSLEVRMRTPVRVLSDPRTPDNAVPGYDHEQRKAAAAGAAAQQMWEMYGAAAAHAAPQEAATDAASSFSSLSLPSSSAPPPRPPAGRRRRGRACCQRAPSPPPPPVQRAGSSSSVTPPPPPPPPPSSYGAPPPPPGYGHYYPAPPPPPGVYGGQNWAAPAPPSGCFFMQQGGDVFGQQWPGYPPPAPEPPEGYYPYGGQQYCDNPGSCSIQ